nr:MAG TPA: hypothetical protein [Herelleviridae sp.]
MIAEPRALRVRALKKESPCGRQRCVIKTEQRRPAGAFRV